MKNSLIDNFIISFSNRIDHFEKVKKEIHKHLEKTLNDSGVMALVTSRVKDPGRLKEKLISRNEEKQYKSNSDIFDDIVDLIGLRIALYFPNDHQKVESIIRNAYFVDKVKVFPNENKRREEYVNRFNGYCAKHYRVIVVSDGVKYKVEIQVASLLMHAWAEVEHDLAYKHKKGVVSLDEYEALDEINGLVIAGEISLQRLQRISELRISAENEIFSNHYQLADYIYKEAEKNVSIENINIGDIEALYKFLKRQNRLTKRKIDNDMKKILFESDVSIAEQMIDLYANDNARNSMTVIKIKADKDPLNFIETKEAYIGKFLSEWIKLEKVLLNSTKGETHSLHTTDINAVIDLAGNKVTEKYNYLKKVRNKLVHGVEIPNDDEFEKLITDINELKKIINNVTKKNTID